MTLDPRTNAFRDDLADERLATLIAAPKYISGTLARVTAGRAAVFRYPSVSSAVDTFFHYGELIYTYDIADGFVWCQSTLDNYVGYVLQHSITFDDFTPTHYISTMGSYIYEQPDLSTTIVDFLPRHCAICVTDTDIQTRDTLYARLHTGAYIPARCLSTTTPHSDTVVTAARRYLGAPYLWAGRCFLGIDCSGLVQSSFLDIGHHILRDVYMQRTSLGQACETPPPHSLLSGDVLFTPKHVVICTGSGSVIHADGISMTVIEQSIDELIRIRDIDWNNVVVRRFAH